MEYIEPHKYKSNLLLQIAIEPHQSISRPFEGGLFNEVEAYQTEVIEQDTTTENSIEIEAKSDFSEPSQHSTEIRHKNTPF